MLHTVAAIARAQRRSLTLVDSLLNFYLLSWFLSWRTIILKLFREKVLPKGHCYSWGSWVSSLQQHQQQRLHAYIKYAKCKAFFLRAKCSQRKLSLLSSSTERCGVMHTSGLFIVVVAKLPFISIKVVNVSACNYTKAHLYTELCWWKVATILSQKFTKRCCDPNHNDNTYCWSRGIFDAALPRWYATRLVANLHNLNEHKTIHVHLSYYHWHRSQQWQPRTIRTIANSAFS